MTLDTSIECLGIAIEKMRSVQNMARLIPIADTKEDIQFVLETMRDELEDGNEQINQLVGD